MEWMPIEKLADANIKTREMFVVKGFNVLPFNSTMPYTTDPYCVWLEFGQFVRWPYPFPPTHFSKLPPDPKD